MTDNAMQTDRYGMV